MAKITLEHQIEIVSETINSNFTSQIPCQSTLAILASLRRLQAIEAQEPFGEVSYDKDSDNWPTNLQFVATHSSNADWINLPSGSKLYALPIAPQIPEGYAPIKMQTLVGLHREWKIKACGRNGSPNHGHAIAGIWDQGNRTDIAGKPCAECALYDEVRDIVEALEASK